MKRHSFHSTLKPIHGIRRKAGTISKTDFGYSTTSLTAKNFLESTASEKGYALDTSNQNMSTVSIPSNLSLAINLISNTPDPLFSDPDNSTEVVITSISSNDRGDTFSNYSTARPRFALATLSDLENSGDVLIPTSTTDSTSTQPSAASNQFESNNSTENVTPSSAAAMDDESGPATIPGSMSGFSTYFMPNSSSTPSAATTTTPEHRTFTLTFRTPHTQTTARQSPWTTTQSTVTPTTPRTTPFTHDQSSTNSLRSSNWDEVDTSPSPNKQIKPALLTMTNIVTTAVDLQSTIAIDERKGLPTRLPTSIIASITILLLLVTGVILYVWGLRTIRRRQQTAIISLEDVVVLL